MNKSNMVFTGIKNEEGDNLVHFLCHSGDVTELIILHDFINEENRYTLVEYNKKQQQCVHIVASQQEDAVEKIKLLTLWGADINGKELKGGDTLLHLAVRAQNYSLVEWLCQQPNINREAMNNDLMTPYHIAFFARDDKMMDVLKQNGVQCRVPLQSETNSYDEDYEPECEFQKSQL
ncbi:NF-kappa-B inhibitor cactus-like [Cotesia glomerata]|nr:NF-kappa-B inhibitor cactus-like [Cotesia glomerata]